MILNQLKFGQWLARRKGRFELVSSLIIDRYFSPPNQTYIVNNIYPNLIFFNHYFTNINTLVVGLLYTHVFNDHKK